MPSESKAERRAMAIAEHEPDKLNPENKGLLKMSKSQLHDFASTKEKGLPEHVHEKKHEHEGRGYGKDMKHGGHGRHPSPRGGK